MATARVAQAVPLADSPLGRTIAQTRTDIWSDSCVPEELSYALSYGAVGATANPTIVVDAWRRDPERWGDRVRALAADDPSATEIELAWSVVAEMSVQGAQSLMHIFQEQGERQGRFSIQTDPTLFRSSDHMVAQARQLATLAPNVIVKLPATAAGIRAIETATYEGVSVNVTVSFTVAQAVEAAAAIERGLQRRRREGLPTGGMGPVVTIMMGRLEDWLRSVVDRDGVIVAPDSLAWAGIAVFKRAYRLFQEHGYTARLLGAAIRHHYHWSELIGGDVVITLPAVWQRRFNASSVEVRPRIDDAVSSAFVGELLSQLPDFARAYEPGGLDIGDFDGFGPTRHTLRTFVRSYHDLLHLVSDATIPDPALMP